MNYLNLFKVKYLATLILCIGALVFGNSCKRAAEKTTEKLIEKSIGDDAEVDLDDEKVVIKTDEGTFTTDATIQSWPDEIPDIVPEFKDGKIVVVNTQEMEDGKNWVVIFEDVSKDGIEKYKEVLKNNDFKINFSTMAGTGSHFAAEKEKLTVMVMGDEGGASVSVHFQE